ncbi:MAG: hypothetical protein ACO3YX_07915 [Candidatus Nanopelagicaceae bacterium]
MIRKILTALALAATVAQPAQANDDFAKILFGVIVGAAIVDAAKNTHQSNPQHQPNYLGPTFTVADRCGWYERMERTSTHDVYHRFDNCTNSLIGQRWVRRY